MPFSPGLNDIRPQYTICINAFLFVRSSSLFLLEPRRLKFKSTKCAKRINEIMKANTVGGHVRKTPNNPGCS